MTAYAAIDANGNITRMSTTYSDGMLEVPDGAGGPMQCYCVDGVFLHYTPEQIALKAARTRLTDWWSNTLMSWVDGRSLADVKIAKWDEVTAAAKAADQGNITVQGVNFKADTETRDELMREALIAQMALIDGLPYVLDYERANGASITLTASQLKALIRAMNARTAQIRTLLRTKRQEIAAATTKAEVAVVVWP